MSRNTLGRVLMLRKVWGWRCETDSFWGWSSSSACITISETVWKRLESTHPEQNWNSEVSWERRGRRSVLLWGAGRKEQAPPAAAALRQGLVSPTLYASESQMEAKKKSISQISWSTTVTFSVLQPPSSHPLHISVQKGTKHNNPQSSSPVKTARENQQGMSAVGWEGWKYGENGAAVAYGELWQCGKGGLGKAAEAAGAGRVCRGRCLGQAAERQSWGGCKRRDMAGATAMKMSPEPLYRTQGPEQSPEQHLSLPGGGDTPSISQADLPHTGKFPVCSKGFWWHWGSCAGVPSVLTQVPLLWQAPTAALAGDLC